MKNLLIILLFFLLCSSSECGEYEPDPGYLEEPSIQIVYSNGSKNFITYSQSINRSKKLAIKNDFPGIDMNSNSTKFWIVKDAKSDSFTINYNLKTFYFNKNTRIDFDTIYISQSSFKNAKLVHHYDTSLYQYYWTKAMLKITE